MNIWPGLCVIMSGGLAFIATAWGVTPQPQKRGIWSSAISMGSPNSGSAGCQR